MTDRTTLRPLSRRAVLGLLGAVLLPGGGVVAADRVPEADGRALISGNTEFGLDLYARLRTTDGNLFYSPYSISNSLAMTYAGARGATAHEMARTLRFALEPGRLHPAFANLVRDINGTEKKRQCELYTANSLWSQTGYPFVADFQHIAKGSYGAALEELDFKRATETARRTINAWVEKQTQDRIKDLLQEGVLKPDTVLVLINAMYFKGAWMHAFLDQATQPADFALGAKGTVRNVPLMRQQHIHRYLDGGTFQALELAYEANELSMLIFLPRSVDGLADFERTLSAHA